MVNHSKKVIVTGITGSVGEAVIEQVMKKYPNYEFYGTYNGSEEQARKLERRLDVKCFYLDSVAQSTIHELPTDISIVINTVGINISSADTVSTTRKTLDKVFDVNTRLPLLLCQRYIPFMIRSKWGRIVNVNSIWGIRGSKENLSYNISKHAMSALTKTIALEYFEYGITANDVCPGPIESRMMNRIIEANASKDGRTFEDAYAEFCSSLRMGRMVTPSEVAAVVVFLCSEEASGINGVSIPVDCGMTI